MRIPIFPSMYARMFFIHVAIRVPFHTQKEISHPVSLINQEVIRTAGMKNSRQFWQIFIFFGHMVGVLQSAGEILPAMQHDVPHPVACIIKQTAPVA